MDAKIYFDTENIHYDRKSTLDQGGGKIKYTRKNEKEVPRSHLDAGREIAAFNGHTEVAKLLVDKGASLEATPRCTPLHDDLKKIGRERGAINIRRALEKVVTIWNEGSNAGFSTRIQRILEIWLYLTKLYKRRPTTWKEDPDSKKTWDLINDFYIKVNQLVANFFHEVNQMHMGMWNCAQSLEEIRFRMERRSHELDLKKLKEALTDALWPVKEPGEALKKMFSKRHAEYRKGTRMDIRDCVRVLGQLSVMDNKSLRRLFQAAFPGLMHCRRLEISTSTVQELEGLPMLPSLAHIYLRRYDLSRRSLCGNQCAQRDLLERAELFQRKQRPSPALKHPEQEAAQLFQQLAVSHPEHEAAQFLQQLAVSAYLAAYVTVDALLTLAAIDRWLQKSQAGVAAAPTTHHEFSKELGAREATAARTFWPKSSPDSSRIPNFLTGGLPRSGGPRTAKRAQKFCFSVEDDSCCVTSNVHEVVEGSDAVPQTNIAPADGRAGGSATAAGGGNAVWIMNKQGIPGVFPITLETEILVMSC